MMLVSNPLRLIVIGLVGLGLLVAAAAALIVALATALVLGLVAPDDLPGGLALPGGPGSQPSASGRATIPPDQLAVMRVAAANAPCQLDWSVLAGIARVESGFGQNMATSSAGAIGYGQFLPSTWAMPGIGNGGNPYDFHDALPAIARYLCQSGASHDVRQALFAYNHADWYVNEVLDYASQYAATTGATANTAFGGPVVDVARTWLDTSPTSSAAAHAPVSIAPAWSSRCTPTLASRCHAPRPSSSGQSSTSTPASSNPATWFSSRTPICRASATSAFTRATG